MSTAKVFNMLNEEVGEIQLNDEIFNVEVKNFILHDVVRLQMAARRAGTASTKTRVEVSGGGRKPWRQKGTGRARSGSRTSPLWRGGGTVFGPKPRSYEFKLNKKVKKLALLMALSSRNNEGNLKVLDSFQMDRIKTKDFVGIMSTIQIGNGLIIVDQKSETMDKSSKNVCNYKVLPVDGVNVYDILLHEKLVVTKPAIESLEKRLLQ
jgi:large subunit ribosomal protein L4